MYMNECVHAHVHLWDWQIREKTVPANVAVVKQVVKEVKTDVLITTI